MADRENCRIVLDVLRANPEIHEAQELLGLDTGQADKLFYGSNNEEALQLLDEYAQGLR